MTRTRTRAPLPPGFAAIWSCVALDLVGFGIVVPILPLYAERFGASPTEVGALVASFSIAQLVVAPLSGRLSDRIGRKPVLVFSLVGTAASSFLMGVAGSLWLLFLARILDGVSGASVSVAQAAVADVARPEERARLLGLLGAAFGLGFVAGPALGSLAALGGAHVPFFVAAALAAANAVVAIRRLPETKPVPEEGAPSDGDRAVRAGRRTWTLAVVAFLAMSAFAGFEATFALFGERRLGFELASTGLVFALIGGAIVAVQVGVVHPVVRRLGDIGALRIGLAANAAGLVMLVGVDSRIELVPGLVLLTLGQGLVTPTLSAVVAGRAAASRRGGALGLQQAAGGLGRVVGPLAAGAAFEHTATAAPFAGGAVVMAVAAAVVTMAVTNRLPSGNISPASTSPQR